MFTATKSGLIIPNSASKKTAKLHNLDVFARNGRVICILNNEDGTQSEKSCTVAEARQRLQAINEDTQQMRKARRKDHRKIASQEAFMEDFHRAIVAAEEQGPFEYADMRRERHNRRARSFGGVSYSTPTLAELGVER